jgi:ribonuclease D
MLSSCLQLYYAALDARVVVMIYDELQTLAEKDGKADAFSKLEAETKKNKNKPAKSANRNKVRLQIKWPP